MGNEFFENLGKTLSETARTVGEKTDDFIAIQKLRSHQASLESQVKKSCRDIGMIVYQKFVDGEPFCEEIADICQEIMSLQCEIAECKEKIADKKGKVICPACGADAPKEADYCMRCGSPIPRQERAQEADCRQAPQEEPDQAGQCTGEEAAGQDAAQAEESTGQDAAQAEGSTGQDAVQADGCTGREESGHSV